MASHARRISRISSTAALGLLCLGAGFGARGEAQSSVHEAVNVREVEVLFDHPTGMRWIGSRFTPDRMQVTEDGQPRTVTRVEPILGEKSEQPAWRILIYLDRGLADRDAVNQATKILVDDVARLTRLGEVEIVEADPRPRVTLAATRDPRVVRSALQDAVRLGDVSESESEGGTAEFERQLDRFVNTVTSERAGPPGLALWVSQPWPLPDLTRLWGMKGVSALRTEAPSGAGEAASRLADLARLLAAERWTVGIVQPSAEAAEGEPATPSLGTVESGPQPGGGGSRTVVLWNVNHLLAKILGWKTSPYNPEAAAQAAEQRLDPKLAPMQLLAAATAGRLVQSGKQMTNFLDLLDTRWHLFFAAPSQERTKLIPVDVGIVEDGIDFTLRQTWSEALEPLAQTDTRLRQTLLDGSSSLQQTLEGVACQIDVEPPKGAVEVRCQRKSEVDSRLRALRLSALTGGCEEGGNATVRHVELGATDRRARESFAIPACANRLAVVVEDPMTARGAYWSGRVEKVSAAFPDSP